MGVMYTHRGAAFDDIDVCYKRLACAIVERAYNDAKITHNAERRAYFLNWFDTAARAYVSNDTADAIISKLNEVYRHGKK